MTRFYFKMRRYTQILDDEKKGSLFQRQGQPDKNGKVLLIPTLMSQELLSTEFLDYWREISYLPCEFWQRWFHTHKFSIVLSNRPEDIPHDLFLLSTTLGNQYPKITVIRGQYFSIRKLFDFKFPAKLTPFLLPHY